MPPEVFSQPPYDRAVELLTNAGLPPPDEERGGTAWLLGLVEGLVELATRDGLTGISNRRTFEGALAREASLLVQDRAQGIARSAEPALLLLLDIDHFKRINDTHGHAAGDAVLKEVSRAVEGQLRPMDMVARIGGEEFGVIVPNCPAPFAHSVAERIRAAVAAAQVDLVAGLRLQVTVSVGGAFAGGALGVDTSHWCERADHQLYQAKSHGRNRVCIEPRVVSDVSADERAMLFTWAADDAGKDSN